MHRQINALVSAGSSPGKLAIFGIALGEAGVDIDTIGGAEWLHDAPLSLILKSDSTDELNAFQGVCEEHEVPWVILRTVAVEINDEAGALGKAAGVVAGPEADLNIYSVNVLSSGDGTAVVGLGVRPSRVDDAVERLVNNDPPYNAWRGTFPGEPSPWWDAWDTLTEKKLNDSEIESWSKDDRRFWELRPEFGS